MGRHIMVQGTSSGSGKSTLVTALCRILSDMGYKVAPFKSQNMSRYSYTIKDGHILCEISSAQAVQAAAARCQITTKLNPIMLKPKGDGTSAVYVDGTPYDTMHYTKYYKEFALHDGLDAASRSLEYLMQNYDMVVLEGAGSPAEINLAEYDIANMRMAHMADDASVVLACDIDRGGAFASLAGTMSLLKPDDASMVRGFLLNKFRGERHILEPGCNMIRGMTGIPVVGVVPILDMSGLPDEDSLDRRDGAPVWDSDGVPAHIDDAIDRLAKDVKSNVDMDAILGMINGAQSQSAGKEVGFA